MDEAQRKKELIILQISYACMIFFPLISLIIALIKKNDYSDDEVLNSHVKWQLGTMIKAIIGCIVIFVLSMILAIIPVIGWLLIMLIYIIFVCWYLYRTIKGFLNSISVKAM